MKAFKPTYLCIKQHSVTGLCYFCKTTYNHTKMLKYVGSGRPYWNNHLKKHGKGFVETIWYCLFLDAESIKEFALLFSHNQNIVESTKWANLKPEDGLDGGGAKGVKHNVVKLRGPHSEETKALQREANIGRLKSEESKKKMRETIRSDMTPSQLVTCEHCGKELRARGLSSHLTKHTQKDSA